MDQQHKEQTSMLERDLTRLNERIDRHLEIYAKNGKELASVKVEVEGVKTNQSWLMKFFWAFMAPMAGGIAYLILNI